MMLLFLALGYICPWVIWLLHENNNKTTTSFTKYVCIFSSVKNKQTLEGGEPCASCTALSTRLAEMRKLTASGGLELRLRAEVWNSRGLILHVMRPNRAGRESLLASLSDKKISSQLPTCHASTCSFWPSFSADVRVA